MTDTLESLKAEAAKYRVERNVALKRAKVLDTMLTTAGVETKTVAEIEATFKAYEPVIEHGTIIANPAVTEEQKISISKLLPQKKEETGEGGTNPRSAPDAASLVATIAATVTAMGLSPQAAAAGVAKTPGSVNPATGNPNPSNGLDHDSISKMTPDQINANWAVVSQALSNGQGTKQTSTQ